jgi:uncharacterized membrane protein
LTKYWALAVLAVGIGVWMAAFGSLAVNRHLALGSHAEDLGFTDQVIWNMLRGRWFQMTVYQGATWNTEMPISEIRSPNSLNAFHIEPMLALLTPIYALGGGPRELLVLQAGAFALGAIPAYRLALRLTGARLAGLAVAATWLLSPLGQWAILSDFHTTALAAPLIVLAAERFAARRPVTAIIVALLAASAREDAAIAVTGLGLTVALAGRWRSGVVLAGLAFVWAAVCLLIMRHYSGEPSPFVVRYAALLGGPVTALQALLQLHVREYIQIVALSGGWLALLSPVSLAPALPLLAMNVFSSSPWMASGRAHYSVLVLPFVVIACAGGLQVAYRIMSIRHLGSPGLATSVIAAALIGSSMAAYFLEGAGPLAVNYAPAELTPHAALARGIAASIPREAAVSATSALYPQVSQRQAVYVFPAVEDAQYVLVDVTASPAPTSVGDVYGRIRSMLESSEWSVDSARDGVILLRNSPSNGCPELDCLPADFFSFVRPEGRFEVSSPAKAQVGGGLEIISDELLPSTSGAIEPDGPRGVMRTFWKAQSQPADWAWPMVQIQLKNGATQDIEDIAALWWYPPARWSPDEIVQIDLPDIPLRQFAGWAALVDPPESASSSGEFRP